MRCIHFFFAIFIYSSAVQASHLATITSELSESKQTWAEFHEYKEKLEALAPPSCKELKPVFRGHVRFAQQAKEKLEPYYRALEKEKVHLEQCAKGGLGICSITPEKLSTLKRNIVLAKKNLMRDFEALSDESLDGFLDLSEAEQISKCGESAIWVFQYRKKLLYLINRLIGHVEVGFYLN